MRLLRPSPGWLEDVSGPAVLIAAFSGRALAQSARRAGYDPLVVDCFGDEDMRAAAAASVCLPARVQVGFLKKPLIEALSRLAAEASSPPIGLVLGAGFECNPRLVAALAERFSLIGNAADTIRRVKDPVEFFGALARLGIRHPETRLTPPDHPDGWLMKRIGGSGGLHIHACPATPRPDPRRYIQKRIAGEAVSAMLLRSTKSQAFAFTTQWVSPQSKRPYRYGGANGWVDLDPDLEARIVDTCLIVGKEFGLTGIISFDFLVEDGEPVLLEVNPRPGATLDVLDDVHGTLFRAHVEACKSGGDPAKIVTSGFKVPPPKSAAYLYADRGPIEIGSILWPAWAADRPAPGTRIGKNQPVATVLAEGANATEAERLCRERLGTLEHMLYDTPTGKGALQ